MYIQRKIESRLRYLSQRFPIVVVSEIVKQYSNAGIDVRGRFSYYRDNNGREIDLIIAENGTLYPIEIGKTAEPGKDAVKNFDVLKDMPEQRGPGAVICLSPIPCPIDDANMAVPIGAI